MIIFKFIGVFEDINNRLVNILSQKKLGKNFIVGYSHGTGIWQMILGADDVSEFQSFWQAIFRNIAGFIHYFK
jgi:hypothetical protein